MQRPKVYITRLIPQKGIDLLKKTCDVEINPEDRPLSREELLNAVKGRDGVIGLLSEKIDREFFEAADSLKAYASYAVGFDNIDLKEATERNIPVSNTPDVLTDATAEMAWALLFAVARKVVPSDKLMRSGRWQGWAPLQLVGGDVKGKTLGIVGAGRIGSAMAMMSRGFEMKVLYTKGSGRAERLDKELGAEKVSFDELVEKSDFISLHTPLTPGTKHLFTAETFRRMKNSAYLINTGRGPVIKEDDLVAALKAGEIAGAGLDVYEFEPKMADGLAELDNVVITAHTGSGTIASREDMSVLAADNLLAMMKGEQGPTCLNPEALKK